MTFLVAGFFLEDFFKDAGLIVLAAPVLDATGLEAGFRDLPDVERA